MKLRKRKSTEKQVEISDHSVGDTENTMTNLSIGKKRVSIKNFLDNKRVKLEETKAVLNETVKIEDEGRGFNEWEEVGEKPDNGFDPKVSGRFIFQMKRT